MAVEREECWWKFDGLIERPFPQECCPSWVNKWKLFEWLLIGVALLLLLSRFCLSLLFDDSTLLLL
jgi:hypothetical protein